MLTPQPVFVQDPTSAIAPTRALYSKAVWLLPKVWEAAAQVHALYVCVPVFLYEHVYVCVPARTYGCWTYRIRYPLSHPLLPTWC